MKSVPRLYLLTCLGLASLGSFCYRGSATELPVNTSLNCRMNR